MVKGFGLTIDYVLYDMSWANVIMYTSVLPTYSKKDEDKDDEVKADDPNNSERVRMMIDKFV